MSDHSDPSGSNPAGPAASGFEALYRRHFGQVLAYARARVDAETALDVAADTFLVAWRRPAAVPAEPLPWLLGVARRVIAGYRRSDARRRRLHARLDRFGIPPGSEPAPDEADGGDRPVLAALAALRERDREVLLLHAWDGLSAADAAVALGISRVAFGVRLHRARRRLAAALQVSDGALAPRSMSTTRRRSVPVTREGR